MIILKLACLLILIIKKMIKVKTSISPVIILYRLKTPRMNKKIIVQSRM